VVAEPTLRVVSVFDTIQGEGPFAGVPATFVRLQGCNLSCPQCDTFYERGREQTISELMKRINWLPRRKLVVITGGEPFLQDLTDFVCELQISCRAVQVETNGTKWPGDRFFSTISTRAFCLVCSPKSSQVDPRLWKWINAVKYIVEWGKVDEDDGLPLSSLGCDERPARPPEGWIGEVYVQPADVGDSEANRRNLRAAVESCLKYGYKLSLQLHKILDLP